MAHDVFISHAVEDKEVANRVLREFEAGGIRCWIAPRDIPPGRDYEEAIVEAIGASRVLLLILSAHSNASPHVKREVQHAFAEGSPTRVIPFRIEPVAYSKSLSYYLGSVQWIDASAPPVEDHLGGLVRHVRAELATGPGVRETEPPAIPYAPPPPAPGVGSRAVRLVAGVVAVVLLAFAVAYFGLGPRGRRVDNQRDDDINPPAPTPTRATPSPTPQVSPTPVPTRTPVRNLNLRIPANLRNPNLNRVRPQ